MIFNVVGLLAQAMALGMVVALLFVRRKDLEARFFRLNSLIAVLLMAVGYACFRKSIGLELYELWRASFFILLIYCASILWLPGFVALVSLLFVLTSGGIVLFNLLSQSRLAYVSVLSGGLFTGVALVAMNIGHSYLSTVKLSIRPLKIATIALFVLIVLRTSFVVTSAFKMNAFPLHDISLLTIGLARILFGLVGPLIMICMVWGTVKIHSTQSATGILYPLLIMALVGEACAIFLTLSTGMVL